MFLNYFGGFIPSLAQSRYPNCSLDANWDDVVLLLHMDDIAENTSLFIDETGKAITRSSLPVVSTDQSRFGGYAGYFDGVDDYIETESSLDFDFSTGDFTIEFWVFPTGALNDDVLFNQWKTGAGSYTTGQWQLRINSSGNIVLEIATGASTISAVTTSQSVVLNTWTNIVVTRSNGLIALYFNGSVDGNTLNFSGQFGLTDKLRLGRLLNNTGTFYSGFIDEVRFTKGVVRYEPNPTKLLCHFDETPIVEETGKALTLYGNAKINPATNITQAAYFDGSGDYLTTPLTDDFQLGSEDFTVEGWIFPTQFSGYHVIIGIGRGNPNGAETTLVLQFNSAGALAPLMTSAATTWNICATYYGTWKTGEWQHFALVRNGNSFNLYQNGVSIGNFTSDQVLVTAQPPSVFIGHTDWNGSVISPYFGYIYNLRVSKGIARYTENFTPSSAALSSDFYTKLLLPFTSNLQDTTGKVMTVAGNTLVKDIEPTVKFGSGSVFFDGNGDYVVVPASADFVFGTGDFTVECWVYPAANQTSKAIVSNRTAGVDSNWSIEIHTTTNRIEFHSGVTIYAQAANALSTGRWTHLAVQRKSGVLSILYDGVVQVTASCTANFSSNNAVYVGYEALGGVGYFNGYIDELRITKGLARYSGSGDVLLMHMQPQDGYKDTVSNTNPTIQGTGALISKSQYKTGTSSMFFSGRSSIYWPFSSAFVFGSGNFTMEAWIYPTAMLYENQIIFSKHLAGSGNDWSVMLSAGKLTVRIASSWSLLLTSATSISLNTWTHIALVRNDTELRFYINGQPDSATYTVNGDWYEAYNYPLSIGGVYNAWSEGFFDGYIDRAVITKAALYTTAFTPPVDSISVTGNTVLACNFNGETGSLWPDDSSKFVSIYGNTVASSAQSKFGAYSAYFDGTGDYLRATYSDFAFGTSDFTIELWFYKTGYTGTSHATLLSLCNGIGSWAGGFGINVSRWGVTDKLRMVDSTGNFKFTGTTTILDNTWYHLALVRDSGVIKAYLNGVLEATAADTTNYTGTIFSIGSDIANTELWVGYIDEFRVRRGVAVYVTNFTPPSQAFTYDAYLTKDENNNPLPVTSPFTYDGSVISSEDLPQTIAFPSCRAYDIVPALTNCADDPYWDNVVLLLHADLAGSPNNFIDETGKPVTVYGNTRVTDTINKFGGYSGYFDGTGDYLSVPASTDFDFGTGDFTIEFWLYPTNVAATGTIYDSRNPDDSGLWVGTYNSHLTFRTSASPYESSYTLIANTWVHLAICRTSGSLTCYANGGQVYQVTMASSITCNGNLYIGSDKNGSGQYFTGHIDELRITKGIARYSANPIKFLSHFDESPIVDETGKTITINGNTTLDTSPRFGGNCVKFDGAASSYLTITDSKLAPRTQDFLIEGWVKFSSLTPADCIFINPTGMYIGVMSNLWYAYSLGVSDIYTALTNPLDWNYIALNRKNGTLSFIVNGTIVGSSVNNTDFATGHLALGSYNGDSYGTDGWLDEVRYTIGKAYSFNKTLALLHFDESVPTEYVTLDSVNAFDKVGNIYSESLSKWGDSSIHFDGTPPSSNFAYLRTGDNTFTITDDFTISFWIYPRTDAATYNIFSTEWPSSGGGFWLDVSGNTIAIWFEGTHGNSYSYHGAKPVPNTWTFVKLRRSSGLTYLYINGAWRSSVNLGSMPIKASAKGLTIGSSWYVGSLYYGSNFNMNDFVISNVADSNPTAVPTEHPTYNASTDLVFAKFAGETGTINSTLNFTIADAAGGTVTKTAGVIPESTIKQVNNSIYIPAGNRVKLSSSKLNLGTSDFTIEYWMYLNGYVTAGSGVANLQIDNREGISSGIIMACLRSDNYKMLLTDIYSVRNDIVTGTTTINLNTWYHVAWVRKGNSIKLYLNGVIDGSANHSGSFGGSIWSLGNTYQGYDSWALNGYMDEFNVVNFAKYTANFAPQAVANTIVNNVYDIDGVTEITLPPSQPFVLGDEVLSDSNPLPPIEQFPSCRE